MEAGWTAGLRAVIPAPLKIIGSDGDALPLPAASL